LGLPLEAFKNRKRNRDSFGSGLSLSQESAGDEALAHARAVASEGGDNDREPPNKIQRTGTLSEFDADGPLSLSQPGGDLPLGLGLSQGGGAGDGGASNSIARTTSISQYLS